MLPNKPPPVLHVHTLVTVCCQSCMQTECPPIHYFITQKKIHSILNSKHVINIWRPLISIWCNNNKLIVKRESLRALRALVGSGRDVCVCACFWCGKTSAIYCSSSSGPYFSCLNSLFLVGRRCAIATHRHRLIGPEKEENRKENIRITAALLSLFIVAEKEHARSTGT